MSSDPIKAVLFNIDETLFDYEHSFRAGIQAVRASWPSSLAVNLDDLIHIYRNTLKQMADAGCTENGVPLSERDGFHAGIFFQAIQTGRAARSCAKMLNDIFTEAYMKNRQTTPNVRMAFMWMKIRRYKIGVVTRQSRNRQTEMLRSLELLSEIDVIVTTRDVNHGNINQPDMYRLAADVLDVWPWETVMVGSDLGHAEGALGALCKFVLYKPGSSDSDGVFQGRTGFRVLMDFMHMPTILGSPEVINWRLSIEEEVESSEKSERTSLRFTPEWSPLTPES